MSGLRHFWQKISVRKNNFNKNKKKTKVYFSLYTKAVLKIMSFVLNWGLNSLLIILRAIVYHIWREN